jgi:hypothetical protein
MVLDKATALRFEAAEQEHEAVLAEKNIALQLRLEKLGETV